VEIQSRNRDAVHRDVAAAVDAMLRNQPLRVEIRERNPDGTVSIWYEELYGQERSAERSMLPSGPRRTYQRIPGAQTPSRPIPTPPAPRSPSVVTAEPVRRAFRLFAFGVSRNRLEQVIQQLVLPVELVRSPREADAVVTLKNYFRKRPQVLREAEQRGVPVYVLRSNTAQQMANLFRSLFPDRFVDERDLEAADDGAVDFSAQDRIAQAMYEAETAAHQVLEGTRDRVELRPQEAWIRRLQHQLAERYNLASRSRGREPFRRVEIYREDENG
ncbi:MAG: AAA family ATPase, partial [Thermomicrobium sp.]|nr:AAA family ATPase [Thermomicrobium sp.]